MNALLEEPELCTPERTSMAEEHPEIPKDRLIEFVGPCENLHKIDQHYIFGDKYRINVWTRKWTEGSICPSNRIERSFCVKYDGKKITNHTK